MTGERTVDDATRRAARAAWAAFRSSDPRKWVSIDPPELPDVGPALRRLAQELPWTRDGLSRTERTALAAVADGADNPIEMFRALQAAEERPFMGDYWAWLALHRLGTGEHPLVVAPVAPVPELTGRVRLAGLRGHRRRARRARRPRGPRGAQRDRPLDRRGAPDRAPPGLALGPVRGRGRRRYSTLNAPRMNGCTRQKYEYRPAGRLGGVWATGFGLPPSITS